jgi:integrase
MAEITGEGYISNKVNQAGTYYMFLTIDGQKQRKTTGTKNEIDAAEKLEQWKAEVRAGVKEDTNLRYEKMRDAYLESGKHVQGSVLEDLNHFFKNMRVSAITTSKLKDFRKWRESSSVVQEYKQASIEKEIALRRLKLRKPTAKQIATIEAESRQWVENAVKATTNRRLTVLRAMLNHAVKEEYISKSDVPYFPMAAGVDNRRTGTVSEETFEKILAEIPCTLHPYLRFLNATGMRSGQAAQLTWDMVNEERTILSIPAAITKTKNPQTLPLVNNQKEAFDWSKWIVEAVRFDSEPILDTTDFRSQWRQACHKLKLGVYDPEKQTYRGLKPHDFRRTAISRMTEMGVDKATAKSISGHKTDSVFNRYDIKDLRHQQNAFEIMASK